MKENKFNKINLKKTKFKDDLSVVKVYAQNGGGSNAANAGLITAGSIIAPVVAVAGVASLGIGATVGLTEVALTLAGLPAQLLTSGCLALTEHDNAFVRALGYTGAVIFGIPTTVISLVERAVDLIGSGLLFVTDTTFSVCSFPLALGILRIAQNRENTKELKHYLKVIREEICDDIIKVDNAAQVDKLKLAVVIGEKHDGQEVTFVASSGSKKDKTYEIKYGLTNGYANSAFKLDLKNIKENKQMGIDEKLHYLHRLADLVKVDVPESFNIIVNGEKVTNIENDELTYTAEDGEEDSQNL